MRDINKKKSKVAFVTLRRSHLTYMAEFVNNSQDMEVTLYTALPIRRCRDLGYNGKVISLAFPIGVLLLLLQKIPGLNPYKRSHLNFIIRKWFDYCVSLVLGPCQVLFAYNGQAAFSSLTAKKKYNAKTICFQASSHILKQIDVRKSYTAIPASKDSTEHMLSHYRNSDYLFAVSKYVANSDLEMGEDPNKIRVLNSGVDTLVFKPTLKPAEDAYDVIMVGSWWKHKGCDMLTEACLDLLKVKLLHVGTVVDCPIPDNPLFKHIDFVPEKDLPNYYAQAKVFALPSLDEGLAQVLIQAALCGLPVVGSSRSGVLDMKCISGYKESSFVISEPLNPENIACAISDALAYYEKMPAGLRETITNNRDYFTKEMASKRLYILMKEIMTIDK